MKELTNENFDETLQDGLVLVDFWAEWCGPCKMVSPILDELSEELDGVTIAGVNVDESPDLSAKYGIRSIPAVFLFKNGELVDKAIGAQPKMKYANMVKQQQM